MNVRRELPPVGTEALDSRLVDAHVARATLGDIARTNRLFGGRAAVLYGLNELLLGVPPERTLTLLDVGAGMGDVTRHIVRHTSRRGPLIKAIALDHLRIAAQLCRLQGLPAVVGDTRVLPFADGSVDIIVVSQVLHHFARESVARLVREFDRVARWGVVVADARPSRAASAGLRLVSILLRFHPVTRRDGVVSIRRGFGRAELTRVLSDAGVTATVRHRPWWRLVAVWRSTHADD